MNFHACLCRDFLESQAHGAPWGSICYFEASRECHFALAMRRRNARRLLWRKKTAGRVHREKFKSTILAEKKCLKIAYGTRAPTLRSPSENGLRLIHDTEESVSHALYGVDRPTN